MTDGEFRAPFAADSSAAVVVSLSDWTTYGELDNGSAAAAILVSQTGGSGVFYDLAVVSFGQGKPVDVATTFIGDRVQVNALTIEEGDIILDMVVAGPDDPMCCPTQHVRQTYGLEGGELKLIANEVIGTVES